MLITTATAPPPPGLPPLAWMSWVPQKRVCLRSVSELYLPSPVGSGVFSTGTLSPTRGNMEVRLWSNSFLIFIMSLKSYMKSLHRMTSEGLFYFLSMRHYKFFQFYTVMVVCWSPVSILSLTRHSPTSRAASQGSSKPSWGMIMQSPGTSSTELTHCSSEKTHNKEWMSL